MRIQKHNTLTKENCKTKIKKKYFFSFIFKIFHNKC